MKKILKIGQFFGSTIFELENFLCGMGTCTIGETQIKITGYPFQPSSIFEDNLIHHFEIDEIHADNHPPTLKIGKELIFVSKEMEKELRQFAESNKVKLAKINSNWTLINEPFLDTEFTEEQKLRTIQLLESNGIPEGEVKKLREEVKEQMMKYNFDTMLWDWTGLGLHDVLCAMRPKYNKADFKDFYWRAMEIEQRASPDITPGKDSTN